MRSFAIIIFFFTFLLTFIIDNNEAIRMKRNYGQPMYGGGNMGGGRESMGNMGNMGGYSGGFNNMGGSGGGGGMRGGYYGK